MTLEGLNGGIWDLSQWKWSYWSPNIFCDNFLVGKLSIANSMNIRDSIYQEHNCINLIFTVLQRLIKSGNARCSKKTRISSKRIIDFVRDILTFELHA